MLIYVHFTRSTNAIICLLPFETCHSLIQTRFRIDLSLFFSVIRFYVLFSFVSFHFLPPYIVVPLNSEKDIAFVYVPPIRVYRPATPTWTLIWTLWIVIISRRFGIVLCMAQNI